MLLPKVLTYRTSSPSPPTTSTPRTRRGFTEETDRLRPYMTAATWNYNVAIAVVGNSEYTARPGRRSDRVPDDAESATAFKDFQAARSTSHAACHRSWSARRGPTTRTRST